MYVCVEGGEEFIHILLILNNVILNRKYEICSKVVVLNNIIKLILINFNLKIEKKLIRCIENIFLDMIITNMNKK